MTATLQSLRTGGLVPTLMARGPAALSILLIGLLGLRAATLLTDIAGAKRPRASSAAAIPVLPPQPDLAALIRASLFGNAESAATPGAAPVTTVPLVLVGVLAATDPARGVAILGPTADGAKVYLVGATLPGGARLSAVQADRVLIDRGAGPETLLLPRQSADTGTAIRPPPPQTNASDRVQQLVQQNPAALTNVMRPQVVLSDGKQKGFRVFPGPNRQAFAKLGLQPGDLVTAINGTALDDPSSGSNVFGTLATAPNARVTLTRDGRQMDLVVNIAQAVNEAERSAPPSQPLSPQPVQAMGPAPAPAADPATIPPP